MTKQIPVHQLEETDNTSCKILPLNAPSDYSSSDAHRHDYYELLFFTEGSGKHMIDFEAYPIGERSIHFVAPGQVHALSRTPDTKGYVIAFSKGFMFMNSTDISILSDFPAFNNISYPVLTLESDLFSYIASIVKKMEEEEKGSDQYKDKILGTFITLLLLKCRSQLSSKSKAGSDSVAGQILSRFNNLLEEKFIELHKVNEYADLLNLSSNHLSETLKKVTGKTAGELIQERIVLEAKRLLLHAEITTKEVGYHLNFSDPSYFSRFFKSNTGFSPEEFRKQSREKYQ
ncbi:MAG: Transcriptional regulator, AraC family [Bacteroidetes bacterium]|jgi:AraC-like DNA-binding protein/mannose-6-phosphate isomerase-like protein (cupin superfamily)|nr:Transcriptional regulator, AraC family [Bacteroidota bacterium]